MNPMHAASAAALERREVGRGEGEAYVSRVGDTASASGSAESGTQYAPSNELTKGSSVGRYLVIGKVGAGGMGVVYAAYDPHLDRKVAIKLLRHDRNPQGARGDQLLQEAQGMARVDHPNVVTVHNVDTFFGQVFITMEFLEGGTLAEWLREKKPAWREVLAIFLKAGEGLCEAHAKGLVHRDFKPDNVLLKDRNNPLPLVTDFGLARLGGVEAHEGKPGRIAGTVGYLAPEQARNLRVDARSDQFSFCVSLYLGLYGEPPFHRDADLVKPLLPVRPVPSGSLVPGWIRKVLIKGLSEDPEQRYASMRELLTALSADPVKARNERLVRGSAALAVLAVLAAGVYGVKRETPQQEADRKCFAEVDARVEKLWGPARQAELGAAFARSSPVGADRWAFVGKRLGPAFEEWAQMAHGTCLVRDNPRERVRRGSCLAERYNTLQSMTDLFGAADQQIVDHALTTVIDGVMPAKACADVSPVVTEGSGVATKLDESMRSELTHARLLKAAGKYEAAIVVARAVVVSAVENNAFKVEGEARLLLGELLEVQGDGQAESSLRDAIVAGDVVGDDELRARAYIALARFYVGHERNQFAQARDADHAAQAIIRSLGAPPSLAASQLTAQAQIAAAQAQLEEDGAELNDEAKGAYRKALELRTALFAADPTNPQLMNAKSNLALIQPGKSELEVLEEVERTQEQTFGPEHPETVRALSNLGVALSTAGKCAEARARLEAAMRILEKSSATPMQLGEQEGRLAGAFKCASLHGETTADLEEREHLRAGIRQLQKDGTKKALGDFQWQLADSLRAAKKLTPDEAKELKELDALLQDR
jgi:hypothetical protein